MRFPIPVLESVRPTLQKLVPLILLMATTAYGQKAKTVLYMGGNTQSVPYVKLYLNNDSTYELKLVRGDCFSRQYYSGRYFYENDSLVLVYQTFHPEPLCQIIDTFHRPRTLKLLYVDDKNFVVDKLPIDLNSDTTNVDHFPMNYVDTAIVEPHGSYITYTYYAPYFTTKTRNVRFYKPEKKLNQTHFIKLKVDNVILTPAEKYKLVFEPFEVLIQQ